MTISDAGYIDLAYEIATKRDYPSWGYWLEQGATTCWEHWGSFARSRDHYFLAAGLEDWFREALGGIRDVQNAYAQFVIRPQIPKKLQHFSISSNTPRGIVSSGWKKTAEGLTMKLEIPVGSTAMVYPPITGEQTVLLDGQALPSTAFQLGSGAYTIYIQN